MEKKERVKVASCVVVIFVTITSLFSLISRLNVFISMRSSFDRKLDYFIRRDALWLVVVLIIILALYFTLRDLCIKNYKEVLSDPFTRFLSGSLVAIQGIISLASVLPVSIISFKSAAETTKAVSGVGSEIMTRTIISNIISLMALIAQILIGIYIARFYKVQDES